MSVVAPGPDEPAETTAPDPVRSAALDAQASALCRVAEELDAAVAGASALAGELDAAWADLVGRGWAQRLDLVRRELAVQADAAADLMRAVTHLAGRAVGTEPGPVPGVPGDAAGGGGSWSLPIPRLGGTEGARASDRRGVVVPTLPGQPG